MDFTIRSIISYKYNQYEQAYGELGVHICASVFMCYITLKNPVYALNFASVSDSSVMMSQVSVLWPAAWKWH